MNSKLQKIYEDLFQDSEVIKARKKLGFASAKTLDNKLKSIGISLPIRLYYEYKLPNNMSPEHYDLVLANLNFMAFPMENDLDKIVGMDNITVEEKIEFFEEMEKLRIKNSWRIKDEVKKTKILNPELANINMKRVKPGTLISSANFLSGVASGYAPEDIGYFINEWWGRIDTQKEQMDVFFAEMEKLVGFTPVHVLCPKHREILLDAARIYFGAS